jgi:hypothetical protein
MTERPEGFLPRIDESPRSVGPRAHPDEATHDEAPATPLPRSGARRRRLICASRSCSVHKVGHVGESHHAACASRWQRNTKKPTAVTL